jgi:hypothetical protein
MKVPEKSYDIVDDYLNQADYVRLKEVVMGPSFPWYYQNCVGYQTYDDPYFYFDHVLYTNGSPWSWFCNDVANIFIQKIQPDKIFRIKVNGFPRENTNVVHSYHKDMVDKHYVGLYYVNTNNGHTLLNINDEIVKVDSVANRMLFFDGSISHTAVSQTDEKIRVNINFDYL